LDALRFCFIGESINHGNKRDNLTWGQDAGWVQAEFSCGDTHYTLKRSIETSRVELKWGDVKLTGTADVEKELTGLLANPKTLQDNVFIPQGKIDSILCSRPSDRLKDFQEAFGLDRAADAHKLLSAEVNGAQLTPGLEQATLQAIEFCKESTAQLGTLDTQLGTIRGQIQSLVPAEQILHRAQEATRVQGAIRQADQNLTLAEDEVAAQEGRLNSAQYRVRNLAKVVDQIKPQADQFGSELVELEQQALRWEHAEQLRGNLATVRATSTAATVKAERAKSVLESLKATNEKLKQSYASMEALKANPGSRPKFPGEQEVLDQWTAAQEILRDLQGAQKSEQLIRYEHETTHLKSELGAFGKGICPTCGQTVHGGPEAAKQRLDRIGVLEGLIGGEIVRAKQVKAAQAVVVEGWRVKAKEFEQAAEAAILNLINGTVAEFAQIKAEMEPLQKDLDEAAKWAADLAAHERGLQGAPEEKPSQERIQGIKGFMEQLRLSEKELAGLNGQVEIFNGTLKGAQAQLAQAQQIRTQLGESVQAPTPEQIREAQGQCMELSNQRALLDQTLQTLGVEQAKLSQRSAEADRLKGIMAQEAKVAGWIEQAKKARDVLHVTQLPALVMREFARVINRQIEYYLETWEAGYRMWLDDSLTFRVKFTDGNETEAARLSGGQKVVAATSFRLAMSDTFARKVGLLVLDEPSNHLDKDNIQHLQALLLHLKQMSTHSGRQILIVTHEDSLMGFLDHVVEIK
jgi:DNA repair exonuclease SbcCD ATPase subunit